MKPRAACHAPAEPAGSASAATAPAVAGDAWPPDDALQQVIALLRVRLRADFSGHSSALLRQRVQRRAARHRLGSLDAYVRLLGRRDDELHQLYRELLAGRRRSFRSDAQWQALSCLLPALVARAAAAGEPLRGWVAGCSTGQEAYALAMLIAEALPAAAREPQLFATDIDAAALATARAGRYSEAELAGIAPERRRRFCVREAADWRIAEPLRRWLVFARHDVTRDPPFARLDLVCCRHLLTYLTPAARAAVLARFAYALKPGGVLFVGAHEGPIVRGEWFEPMAGDGAICRRTAAPADLRGSAGESSGPRRAALERRGAGRRVEDRLPPADAHRAALADLAAANRLLAAANDEVHDANQRLRLANHELDASRDELNAMAEGLRAVNAQLQAKLAELASAHDDLGNLFASSASAMLVLDRQLRVRRYTPALQQLVRLRPADVGRPFTDLALQVEDDTLAADAAAALDGAAVAEREVQQRGDDGHFIRRIAPYRRGDHGIDGVVISFIDVTALRRQERQLRELNASLEARVEERTRSLQQQALELQRLEREVALQADRQRQQLGRDLHDSLGQQLSGIALLAGSLRDRITEPAQAGVLAKLEAAADAAKLQLRAIVEGLSPVEPDARGLAVALCELTRRTRELHGIDCRLDWDERVPTADPFVANQLYLIASEAVHNAVKHARARSIAVAVSVDGDGDGLRLAVRDDGRGFDPAAAGGGMGLRIMAYRCRLLGGALQIDAGDGGSCVSCRLPPGAASEARR